MNSSKLKLLHLMLLNLEVRNLAVCYLLWDFFYQVMSVRTYVCMYVRKKLKIYEQLVSYQ